MVCPLRIVIAVASLVVLAVSALWLAFSKDEDEHAVLVTAPGSPPTDADKSSPPKRKLWRSFAALFTGEVLYDFYHRVKRPHAKAA